MTQVSYLDKQKTKFWHDRRWYIIIAGLIVQLAVMAMALISLQQWGRPEVAITSIAGRAGICRITSVATFTDAWVNGIQPGMFVRAFNDKPPIPNHDTGTLVNCKPNARSIFVQVIDRNMVLHLNTAPQFIDIPNQILALVLAAIFSLTGITIYLRTSNPGIARTAYALFYSTSLLFFLININNTLWTNILLYILGQITWGMAATFVYLLPRPSNRKEKKNGIRPSPYTPWLVSIVLTAVSLPVLILFPEARLATSLATSGYALFCMIAIGWVMFWGLRRMKPNEKQIIRIIAASIVFLLLGLAFDRNVVNYSSFVINSFAHINTLNTIPLLTLPIICGYTLIRHQFLGTTSLLSRHVMRVLLWILLGSFFVIPSINIIHIIDSNLPNLGENRYYFYAGFMWLSLLLFPLLWNKIRNFGDQIFYHDFYEYNRSLRELSAELTRLQHLDQICTFVLPHLATLLNATGVALLVRRQGYSKDKMSAGELVGPTDPWRIYINAIQSFLNAERLTGIANLALTHNLQHADEPLLLDGMLLLALYDGDYLSGFLCLGSKLNFEPYSRQDKSFLATLAAQLSVLEVNSRYLEQAESDAQQLTALNRRVISAQEDERRHLALELHDEVLQQAMLLVRQLSDASTMTDIAEAMPLARSLVTGLRHTCLELRPPLLDELGLEEALHWLAKQTEQRTERGSTGKLKIDVLCVATADIRLPAEVELSLYRVAQEALSNVLKHAKASEVVIRLRYSLQGKMSLLICDNGRGFTRGQATTERLGLVGMHERIAAVGGQLQMRTYPGRGVIIRATYSPAVIYPEAKEQVEVTR